MSAHDKAILDKLDSEFEPMNLVKLSNGECGKVIDISDRLLPLISLFSGIVATERATNGSYFYDESEFKHQVARIDETLSTIVSQGGPNLNDVVQTHGMGGLIYRNRFLFTPPGSYLRGNFVGLAAKPSYVKVTNLGLWQPTSELHLHATIENTELFSSYGVSVRDFSFTLGSQMHVPVDLIESRLEQIIDIY